MVSGNILRELNIRWLGKLPYGEAYILQKGLHSATSQESSPFDYLLLLEHNNVVTIGRSGDINNLLVSKNYGAGLFCAAAGRHFSNPQLRLWILN